MCKIGIVNVVSSIAISASASSDWVDHLDQVVKAIMDAAQVAKASVVRERAAVGFYIAIRRMNGHLDELMVILDRAASDLQSGTIDFQAGHDSDDAPGKVIDRLTRCYRIVNGLYVISTYAGFKGRALTKKQVNKLGIAAERLLDYVMWMNDLVSPEERERAEDSFAAGLRDFEAGETVALL